LKSRKSAHRLAAANPKRPEAGREQVLIKGRSFNIPQSPPESSPQRSFDDKSVAEAEPVSTNAFFVKTVYCGMQHRRSWNCLRPLAR
jgi:hypothetical protein